MTQPNSMPVGIERDGPIAWVTLNRPTVGNAIDIPMAEEFLSVLKGCDSDPDCRVIVITGSGSLFCAGGDVAQMAAQQDSARYLTDLTSIMHKAVLLLAASSKIVISAVNGPAAGAGLSLVLSADYCVSVESATFRAAYSAIGLTPDCGVSFLLPATIGLRNARSMALRGTAIDAPTALAWQLVDELSTESELKARAEVVGQQFARGAHPSTGRTKQLLARDWLDRYEDHLREESQVISEMITTADSVERIQKFLRRNRERESIQR
jgi:2-(1,2-epoxy-1,2-dihydrophenyl)acetyl-CoA isomerase